ncbi:hypothetical protein NYR79_10040 [Actinobacillus equuli subsp. haemolyticus]|uniref:hypothetical protein n=1 Tax=Actinobacillus equuli TaxID=718 RepID=UPI002441CBA4|nr:hypothetical protein [Actinobacillus equuli]WGE71175.1 hypothetical protein NYR79_10040 [Actinobacillus equuli subsp. haemolyticus]
MRYKALLSFFFAVLSSTAVAKWEKINDVDYTWGPFKIYNISLFTETGEYKNTERPVMLTLKYSKPVDGRDFAISVAKSWANLGITLPAQDEVIDRLRKILPDLKPDDALSYIALADRGYFVLNDQVIEQDFNAEFNDAMLAIWLDPKVEFSYKLIAKKVEGAEQEVHQSAEYRQSLEEISIEPKQQKLSTKAELTDQPASTEQAVDSESQSTKLESPKSTKKVDIAKVAEVKPANNEVEKAQNKTAATVPETAVEPVQEKTETPAATPEAEPQPVEQKTVPTKEELENPEKEVLPESDPTPVFQLPVS